MEKCGGTSLRHALEDALPERSMYNFFSKWNQHHNALKKHIEQGITYHVINGHFNYGLHEVLDIEPVYTTQMREPSLRFISHYLHWCSHSTNNHYYKHIQQNCLVLNDFLTDDISIHLENFMTRRLSGNLGKVSITEEDYERALERLKTFAFVTFLEDEASQIERVWEQHLGLQVGTMTLKHMNKKLMDIKKTKPTEEDMQLVAEKNKWDILLYNEARKLQ